MKLDRFIVFHLYFLFNFIILTNSISTSNYSSSSLFHYPISPLLRHLSSNSNNDRLRDLFNEYYTNDELLSDIPSSSSSSNHNNNHVYQTKDSSILLCHECAVCLEDLKQGESISFSTCGHVLHHECFMQWLDKSKSCPVCRKTCHSKFLTPFPTYLRPSSWIRPRPPPLMTHWKKLKQNVLIIMFPCFFGRDHEIIQQEINSDSRHEV